MAFVQHSHCRSKWERPNTSYWTCTTPSRHLTRRFQRLMPFMRRSPRRCSGFSTRTDMAMNHRIAFFSPLSPVRSGIADYSDELLPDLSRLANVEAIVADDHPVHQTATPAPVKRLAHYAAKPDRYDLNVYQIGNNVHHHGYMLPVLRRVPGILVLHDYCLQYLMLGT